MTDVLSDLLQHSLRIVLCGTAAGTTSAAERAYYAHRQNKFWKILHATGLTPELLQPRQYRSLLQHGIGQAVGEDITGQQEKRHAVHVSHGCGRHHVQGAGADGGGTGHHPSAA